MDSHAAIKVLAASQKTWSAESLLARRAEWQVMLAPTRGGGTFETTVTQVQDLMDRAAQHLRCGPGLFVIRGLRVDQLNEEQAEALLSLVASRLGKPAPMDADGSLVHRVEAVEGNGFKRGYQTRGALALHNDSCDFISFLATRTPARGGERRVASAPKALFNLLHRMPEAADLLQAPIKMPRYFNGIDASHCHELPLLSWNDDGPLFVIKPGYVRFLAKAGVNPFTSEAHQTAYDAFVNEVNDAANVVTWAVERGDLEIYDNFRILHARNAFEDGDKSEHRRLLLRTWIADPRASALPQHFRNADDYRFLFGARLENAAYQVTRAA